VEHDLHDGLLARGDRQLPRPGLILNGRTQAAAARLQAALRVPSKEDKRFDWVPAELVEGRPQRRVETESGSVVAGSWF